MDDNIPDSILESYTFDSVVVPQRLSFVRCIQGPECGESALLKKVVKRGENGEK